MLWALYYQVIHTSIPDLLGNLLGVLIVGSTVEIVMRGSVKWRGLTVLIAYAVGVLIQIQTYITWQISLVGISAIICMLIPVCWVFYRLQPELFQGHYRHLLPIGFGLLLGMILEVFAQGLAATHPVIELATALHLLSLSFGCGLAIWLIGYKCRHGILTES